MGYRVAQRLLLQTINHGEVLASFRASELCSLNHERQLLYKNFIERLPLAPAKLIAQRLHSVQ